MAMGRGPAFLLACLTTSLATGRAAPTCAEFCAAKGQGLTGHIIGTSPVCEGSCSGDCQGGYCEKADRSEFADYGVACLTGDKVCCCSRTQPEQVHLSIGSADASGATGMVAAWLTWVKPDGASVQFGQSTDKLDSSASATSSSYGYGYHHHAEMGQLQPGTRYYYRVGDTKTDVWSKVFSFKVPPSDRAADFAMSIFADMGYLGSKERPMEIGKEGLESNWSAVGTRRALERLKDKGEIDLVWHVGDISYADDAFGHKGKVLSFDYENVYNGFMNWMQNITSTMPYMVSVGNHESECHSPACVVGFTRSLALKNFTAYNARWHMPSASSGGVASMWYSFNVGNVHFVSLNSETDWPGAPLEHTGDSHIPWLTAGGFAPEGEYLRWLEADLKKAAEERARGGRQWIIAGAHRPFDDLKANVLELFQKYGVDLYFAGHAHSYARYLPAAGKNFSQVVVGGAGCDEMAFKPYPSDSDECRQGQMPGELGVPVLDVPPPFAPICLVPARKGRDGRLPGGAVFESDVVSTGVLRVMDGGATLKWQLIVSETGQVIDEATFTKEQRKPATPTFV